MSNSFEQPWDVVDVTAAFDLGAPTAEPVAVARGAMGFLWQLQTETGSWAVKHLFDAAGDAEVANEAALVDGAVAAGVRAPAVVRTTVGNVVAQLPGAKGDHVHIRVYVWVENTGSPSTPISAESCAEAGQILGRLHRVAHESTVAPDDWYRRRHLGGRWSSMVDQVSNQSPSLGEAVAAVVDELTMLDGLAVDRSAGPWHICHRDFDPGNTLVDRHGRLVVVDWDNAGPLMPIAEVAYSLLGWASDERGTPRDPAIRAFLNGYSRELATPRPAGVEVFSVALAGRLNFLAQMLGLVVDNDVPVKEREWAASVSLSVVSTMPTRETLHRFYDVWNESAA